MKANSLYLSQMRAARRAADLLDRYPAIVKGVCIAQYKSNRGAYFMYVNSEQCMTGDNALSYAFGMSGAEYHYHKNHFLLVFVLLNNGQYLFAHSLNRPADVPRIDDLARNFRIDPDDNTSLIHTEEGYGDYVDAQLYKM